MYSKDNKEIKGTVRLIQTNNIFTNRAQLMYLLVALIMTCIVFTNQSAFNL